MNSTDLKKSLSRGRNFRIRLANHDELPNWRAIMDRHHYLGFERIVGHALHYIATIDDEWVALLGWGSAALKCGPRDQYISWDQNLHYRRLHLIANNVRFLILPGYHQPNLASRLLAMNIKRLSGDWLRFHGNPIVLAETFVDAARFKGTCYRAAGWKEIGQTLIYEAIAMAFPGWDLNRPGTWSSSRTRAPADSVRPRPEAQKLGLCLNV